MFALALRGGIRDSPSFLSGMLSLKPTPGVLPLARWAGRGSALPGAAAGEEPQAGFVFV